MYPTAKPGTISAHTGERMLIFFSLLFDARQPPLGAPLDRPLSHRRSYGKSKRAAYELPDGVEFLVGSVKTSFSCPAKNGYYADVDNNCQIFHVCNVVPKDDGSTEVQQYSFLCGNQTVFSQFSLTCALPEDAIPCGSSADFFYLNDRIGQEKVNLHDDADLQRAIQIIPRYQQAPFKA
ncbi:hypothetical protein HPB48_003029 [Haemaphysalis longicornis]|uniref:Chitin-binding type-2 domain-containing protein n=1 Tax=Haemaphysalis longicornis TaxID=44386 RepID=A0A9J6FEM1_HAELO|nr:hypothetical protein HPB48_003029 [Haemaphysalis longicornis]